MKKSFFTLAVILSAAIYLSAQDCKVFIPYTEGAKIVRANYNKKDKLTGKVSQEVTKVQKTDNGTTYQLKQIVTDDKGKDQTISELTFRCENNNFYIDMNSMMPPEQSSTYNEASMKVSMEDLEIPSNLKPGDQLKEGFINFTTADPTPMALSFKIKVFNRLVEATETITTPAGSFECIKIKEDVQTESIIRFTVNTVSWYAEGIGVVRSETYQKGDLITYSILESWSK